MRQFLILLAFMTVAIACRPDYAVAQVHSVDVETPRSAGWMVADIIPIRLIISVDERYPLQTASLPPRGSVNYWLELRDLRVQEHRNNGEIRYVIELDYQTFYVPLDVQYREIPALSLTFGDSGAAVNTTIPAWSFSVSPLRGVAIQGSARPVVPESDEVQGLLSQRTAVMITGVAAVMLMTSLALLAWFYASWPFHKRRARPFSAALRQIRGARREGSDQAYRRALQKVHRAFDTTAHRRILADDLDMFMERYPAFAGLGENATVFFRASRYAFFADDVRQAMSVMSWQSLAQFTRKLAAAERTRP